MPRIVRRISQIAVLGGVSRWHFDGMLLRASVSYIQPATMGLWLFPDLSGMMTNIFHVERHAFTPEELEASLCRTTVLTCEPEPPRHQYYQQRHHAPAIGRPGRVDGGTSR